MRTHVGKVSLGILAAIAAYIVIGVGLSKLVFPHPQIDFETYFRPGDVFGSSAEGFRQTVLAVNDGWLHTRLEIMPHAGGPPEHLHENFEERFTVREGTVSVLVNGEKKTLRAGESLTIPPMTPHRPFNEQIRSRLSRATRMSTAFRPISGTTCRKYIQ